MLAEDGHEVGGDIGEMFADQHSVIGEKCDLEVLLGEFNGSDDVWAKDHGFFSQGYPVFPRDV